MGFTSQGRQAVMAFLLPLLLAIAAGAVSVAFGHPALPLFTPDAALSVPASLEGQEEAIAGSHDRSA